MYDGTLGVIGGIQALAALKNAVSCQTDCHIMSWLSVEACVSEETAIGHLGMCDVCGLRAHAKPGGVDYV
jgi:hypothetical protein